MNALGGDETIPAALRTRLQSALAATTAVGSLAYRRVGDMPGGEALDAAAMDAAAMDVAAMDVAAMDVAIDGPDGSVIDGTDDAASEAAAYLVAGESLLAAVLRADCASRDTALDLLAADALVTRAFERAADSPASLPALAEAAMRRIARLAGAAG